MKVHPDILEARLLGQPFALAFLEWMASANVADVLRVHPRSDRDAVEIEFPHTRGILTGYADDRGISVAVINYGECWDFVLMEDVLAEKSKNGWRCSLCSPSEQAHFESVGALWEDHIFRPLLDWVEMKLRPSQGIALYGGDGVTWAVMCAADDGKGEFHVFDGA